MSAIYFSTKSSYIISVRLDALRDLAGDRAVEKLLSLTPERFDRIVADYGALGVLLDHLDLGLHLRDEFISVVAGKTSYGSASNWCYGGVEACTREIRAYLLAAISCKPVRNDGWSGYSFLNLENTNSGRVISICVCTDYEGIQS